MAIHIIAAIGSAQSDPGAISAAVIVRPRNGAIEHSYYFSTLWRSVIITGMVTRGIAWVLYTILITDAIAWHRRCYPGSSCFFLYCYWCLCNFFILRFGSRFFTLVAR